MAKHPKKFEIPPMSEIFSKVQEIKDLEDEKQHLEEVLEQKKSAFAQFLFNEGISPPHSKSVMQEHPKGDRREKVINFLKKHPGKTISYIRKNVRVNHFFVVALLSELEDKGVVKSKVIKKMNARKRLCPKKVWSLVG